MKKEKSNFQQNSLKQNYNKKSNITITVLIYIAINIIAIIAGILYGIWSIIVEEQKSNNSKILDANNSTTMSTVYTIQETNVIASTTSKSAVKYKEKKSQTTNETKEKQTEKKQKIEIIEQTTEDQISSQNESIIPIQCDLYGEIDASDGKIQGFTSEYVLNNGDKTMVRKSLGNRWHINAVRQAKNYGITWYEVYDSDDGDYYGWVDSSYLDFYNNNDREEISVEVLNGKINKHGNNFAHGFVTEYIKSGDKSKWAEESETVEDGAYVTVKDVYDQYNHTWCELYDTNTNAYYGWIPMEYIDFFIE